MPKPKPKTKTKGMQKVTREDTVRVFREMSAKGVSAKMRKFTKEERSQQARAAVASRKDRRGNAPWYTLLVFPPSYLEKGAANAVAQMNAKPVIAFFSQDREEVVKMANSRRYRTQVTDVGEQAWDPGQFTVRRKFLPDASRIGQALAGGQA
jgi:hypothetical protein